MPTYEITTPDGKTLEVTAPDGATQEQVLAYAQANYKPQAAPKAPAPSAAQSARAVYDSEPWGKRALISAGGALTSIGRGIGQIMTPDDSEIGRKLQASVDADMSYQAGMHGSSNIVGQALPYLATLPVGGAEAAALRFAPRANALGRTAIKAGAAALEGAGYGALNQVETGGSRGQNATFGAAAGAGGRAIAGGVGKGLAFAQGKWADPALQRLNQLAKDAGIPATIGDLAPGVSRWVENRLQPLLLSGRRETMLAQQDGIARETRQLQDGFRTQREAAAAVAGKSGESPEGLLAGGIADQYNANRAQVSRLYRDVADTARTSGAGPVVPQQSAATLARVLTDAPGAFSGFTPASVTAIAKLKQQQPLSFEEIQALRKEVGNAAWLASRRVQMGNATTATANEAHMLGNLRAAIEGDISAWGQQAGGAVLAAQRKADGFFREKVAPYRTQREISPYIKPGANPDRIGNKLRPDKPESARRIMGATDNAGRAAGKELFVSRAADAALDPSRQQSVSIHQLIKQLDTGKAGSSIFSAGEQAAIDRVGGLAKLLERSAGAKADPQTGQLIASGLTSLGIGGAGAAYGADKAGPLGSLAGLAGALLAGRTMNAATKSEIVKRFVFAGVPENQARSALQKLLQNAATRAPQAGVSAERPLEIDIVGGRRATREEEALMRQEAAMRAGQ